MEIENVNSKSEPTIVSDVKAKWKRRSKLEQELIVGLTVVALVLFGLILFIIIKHAVAVSKCTTPSCLIAASTIITHIDPKVDPCDDFFKFACGKFIENTHDDLKASSVFKIKAQVERQLKEIIEEPIKDDDHYLVKSQKKFFKACMNESAIEEESLDIFKETLKELHGWPVVLGYYWNEHMFDWKNMIYILNEKGYSQNIMLSIGTIEDPINSTYIIRVIPPNVQKIKREHKLLYIKYMTDVAVKFGAEKNRAGLEMERVYNFIESLRKVLETATIRKNETTNSTWPIHTVAEYQDIHHEINWLEFINTLLYPVGEIANDTNAWFPKHEFTTKFFELIYKTRKVTLANYIIWTVIEDIMSYLSKELKEIKGNYTCSTGTVSKVEDRFKFCQKEMKQCFLPQPSDILYARKYLPEPQRKQLQQMSGNVKTEFKTLLKRSSWMDDESKKNALEKAEAIVEIIGAPRDYFNDAIFAQLPPAYKEEDVESDSYFEMLLSYKKRIQDANYFHLHMNINDTKWDDFYEYVSNVDAFYSFEHNAILIPVGILQDVFYDTRRPMYLNYGAIGGIIGHELTHGFGEAGSKVDKEFQENGIWTNTTQEAYEERIKCIIEEADNFEVERTGKKLNGTQTLDENIADYTGLKVAYAAYKDWVYQNGEEPELPGIDYTPYQLFWISAISYECFHLDAEKRSSSHADSSFRGTGPIRNNPDFATDFDCPVGSRMNPAEKCQLF